jgi:hypothetical protein
VWEDFLENSWELVCVREFLKNCWRRLKKTIDAVG